MCAKIVSWDSLKRMLVVETSSYNSICRRQTVDWEKIQVIHMDKEVIYPVNC